MTCDPESATDTLNRALVKCDDQSTSQAASDIYFLATVRSVDKFVIAAQSDVNAMFVGCFKGIAHHDTIWFRQP